MGEKHQRAVHDSCGTDGVAISRRAIVGSSGVGLLGLLAGSALGQDEVDPERLRAAQEMAARSSLEARREASEIRAMEIQGGLDPQQRAFFEKMRDADAETRTKMMQDWSLQRMLERLKNELGVSQEEWTVIKPRVETVYRLVHTQPGSGKGDIESLALVAARTRELQELLRNKEAKPEEIKAKLTALRAAKEQARQELVKARQNLRQVMTLRQEAVLVLNGLLD